MTENADQNVDAKFNQWRTLLKSHATIKRMAVFLGVITALGWLLFLAKLGQTSDLALRYSREAQESVGRWTMILLLMSVASVVLFGLASRRRKQASALAQQLVAALRDRLATTDDGERPGIESRLRELGA